MDSNSYNIADNCLQKSTEKTMTWTEGMSQHSFWTIEGRHITMVPSSKTAQEEMHFTRFIRIIVVFRKCFVFYLLLILSVEDASDHETGEWAVLPSQAGMSNN